MSEKKKQAMRLKELFVELQDRIMLRHRSGEGYQNISASLKVPKNIVASLIIKWKKFGTTKCIYSVTLEEVVSAVRSFPNGKTTGPDGFGILLQSMFRKCYFSYVEDV